MGVAFATRRELVDQVVSWLDRDELADKTAGFITLAEGRLWKRLRARCMQLRAYEELTDRWSRLPADWLEAISLRVCAPFDDAGQGATKPVYALRPISREDAACWRGSHPRGYVIAGDEIEVVPAADRSLFAQTGRPPLLEMVYFARPAALDSDGASNAVLLEHPEIYLFGTLLIAQPWLKKDDRIALCQSALDDAVTAENEATKAAQYSGGILRARIRPL